VPFDSLSVEYASHSTCIASPEAYLSFYESDDTYQKMAQDVINMPHVKQYKTECESYSTLHESNDT
jgi:hypothetical protein